jgi:hypothetical protein
MRTSLTFATASLIALAAVSSATAGQLDRKLLENAGAVIDHLSKHKVKNVGILPFEVRKGSRAASLDAAPLARAMPVRLENTLVMALEVDSFGVVRDPAGTAKAGDYLADKAEFDKLFDAKYERAWDGAKVGVDRFLTGRIEPSPDSRSRTKVSIVSFTKASWKDGKVVPTPVVEFEVPTDRTLLADLGYNFALPRSALSPKVKPTARTRLAVSLVTRREAGSEAAEGGSSAFTPDDIAGFAFEVRYDGAKQKIEEVQSDKAGQKAPEYVVPAPPPGAKVTLHLKRTDPGDLALGVVLKVNGVSTCDKEDADSQLCRRWVYGPDKVGGKDEPYEGFYMGADASTLLRFETIGKEKAKGVAQLGRRTGWIDIDVFASQGKDRPKLAQAEEEEAEAPLVMTRSVPKAAKGAKFADYQKSLFAANRQRRGEGAVKKRTAEGIIYHPINPEAVAPTSEAALPNPELIGHLSIRYRSGK